MPQFPHHSKLCHCCQSIAHLSPEIMAKKSTKDGDLTLTEKLIHGDLPTGEAVFSVRMLGLKPHSGPSLSLDISRLQAQAGFGSPVVTFQSWVKLLPSGDICPNGKFAFVFLTIVWGLHTQANKHALWHGKKLIAKSFRYPDFVRGAARLSLTLSLQWAF